MEQGLSRAAAAAGGRGGATHLRARGELPPEPVVLACRGEEGVRALGRAEARARLARGVFDGEERRAACGARDGKEQRELAVAVGGRICIAPHQGPIGRAWRCAVMRQGRGFGL